ncbi:unnamed protein product [Parajaminaea phylloscopi]
MADSLDDNFVLEEEFTSGSAPSSSRPGTSAKRSREQLSDGDDSDGAMRQAAGASTAAKKAKRKEREKARKARLAVVRQEEEDTRQNPATLPPEFQADWLRRELRSCKGWKELSEIELNERAFDEASLIDSTPWDGSSRDASELAKFLHRFVPNLSDLVKAPKSPLLQTKGSPAVLVLTNNALRAVELARSLRELLPSSDKTQQNHRTKRKVPTQDEQPDAAEGPNEASSRTSTPTLHIAKLFARHFSAKEQTEFLASHNVAAGAGTSQRVAALLARNALDVTHLQALVLDAGWRDEKKRGLLDEDGGREGVKDAWELLRARRPDLKVLLF